MGKTIEKTISDMEKRGIKKCVITNEDGTTYFTFKPRDLLDAAHAGLDVDELTPFLLARYKERLLA